jgi:hypothetical protein
MFAMTRSTTDQTLPFLTAPISRQRRHDLTIPQFLILNVGLGAGIGVLVATVMLLTDTFGIFTLISAGSDPILTTLKFVFGGVMIFTPLVFAVAVGLVGHSK